MSKTQAPGLPARGSIVVERNEVVHSDALPAHHLDKTQTRFTNPWPSYRSASRSTWIKFFLKGPFSVASPPPDMAEHIPLQNPDWGAGKSPEDIKATWLGHACFLVELPAPAGASRGPRILFDPVLSHRCSPFTWAGPARMLPTPAPAADIPQVDAVVISHNHYDHMDFATLSTLLQRHAPHFFAPLGNTPHLASVGVPRSHIHTLDWWEDAKISVDLPAASPTATITNNESSKEEKTTVKGAFTLTCTPAQHTANRGMFDRWTTLWSSWAVVEDLPAAAAPVRAPRKVYFAGDTGYRSVFPGEDEDTVPRCPAFKEIGDKFGGFDVALLPIGAYAPRELWSPLHASPGDAVQMFKDVRARRALGMHWGTWSLTSEPPLEPPELLKTEAARAGLEEGAFGVSALGETVFIS